MYVEHLKTPNNRGHDKVSYQFCISCFYPVLDSNPKNHLWFLWIYPPRRSLPGLLLWVGCGCWLPPSGTRLFKCCVSMAVYWLYKPWSMYLSTITRSWLYHVIQSSKFKRTLQLYIIKSMCHGEGMQASLFYGFIFDVDEGTSTNCRKQDIQAASSWCGNHVATRKIFNLFGDLHPGFIHPPAIYSKMVNWKMYLLNLVIYQLECYDICW